MDGASNTASLPEIYNLPEELRALPQWLLAGPDKAPMKLVNGRPINASIHRRTDFMSFDAAVAASAITGLHIGFVLTPQDPFLCIDMDVKNNETHPGKESVWTKPEDMARYWEFAKGVNSYTERSRSGWGLHIFVKGTLPCGIRGKGIEIYPHERFIICTGNRLPELPATIEDGQELLDDIISSELERGGKHKLFADWPEPKGAARPDDAVLVAIRGGNSGEKFDLLWSGKWQDVESLDPGIRLYPSQSEADCAMLEILWWHTGYQRDQTKRLFRQSQLAQWDTLRNCRRDKSLDNDRYLDLTLKNVCAFESARREAEVEARASAFRAETPRNILRKITPPPFNLNDVPPAIARFAHARAQASGEDVSGVTVAALVAAAAMIHDGMKLELQPETGWIVCARIWAFLCGSSGDGKSPSINAATAQIRTAHDELYKCWIAANPPKKGKASEKDDGPPCPKIYTSDATVAALSEVLKDNDRGILLLTHELGTLLGRLDGGSNGAGASERAHWLQLRDGGQHQIDRVTRGSVYVKNWSASILGACTQKNLRDMIRALPEDGLIQRFIPCLVGLPNLDAAGDARGEQMAWDGLLSQIYTATGMFHHTSRAILSPSARDLFQKEQREIRETVHTLDDNYSAFASHLTKHRGMLGEVALVFHVIESMPLPHGAMSFPAAIAAETMQRAINFMRTVRRHAWALYSSVLSISPAYELARSMARSLLAEKEPLATTSRDWMRQHCKDYRTADKSLQVEGLSILEDAGWISGDWKDLYAGSPRKYQVHPRIYELYGSEGKILQAKREAVRSMFGVDN